MRVLAWGDGKLWRAVCECGWSSRQLPFPDPDSALHVGRLHDAVVHPELIDWEAENGRYRRFLRTLDVEAPTEVYRALRQADAPRPMLSIDLESLDDGA